MSVKWNLEDMSDVLDYDVNGDRLPPYQIKLFHKLYDERRPIRFDLVKRIRDEISKHDFPEMLEKCLEKNKSHLDTIDETLKNYGFDLSSGFPTVEEYLGAEFEYGDIEKATARLRKTPHPSKDLMEIIVDYCVWDLVKH